MVCVYVEALPLSSVAVQTLVITELFPVPATVVSADVIVTSLSQLSDAAAVPVAEAAVLASHSTVTSAGDVVNVGAVVSTTVIVCVYVDALPLSSVAVQTLVIMIANFKGFYDPSIILGCFILIWVNDSFAYIVGKSLGKQKLFYSISPHKTVEGFLGGLLFCCISASIVSRYIDDTLSTPNWLIIAIIVSVFGTLGDLIESKLKRESNVKDSGKIMPGHGGILDRLDSVIFASPYIYLFLKLI